MCCTDSSLPPRRSSPSCVAQQQGRVVSGGGLTAYTDYRGIAPLLRAATRCVTCLRCPTCCSTPKSTDNKHDGSQGSITTPCSERRHRMPRLRSDQSWGEGCNPTTDPSMAYCSESVTASRLEAAARTRRPSCGKIKLMTKVQRILKANLDRQPECQGQRRRFK